MTFIQFETIHFWFGLVKIVLYAKEKAVGFLKYFLLRPYGIFSFRSRVRPDLIRILIKNMYCFANKLTLI